MTTGNQTKQDMNSNIIGALTGYFTGAMPSAHFEQAIKTANKFNLPIKGSGISTASNIVSAKVAFISILISGLQNGTNGVSNATFSSTIGAFAGIGLGPAGGALVGASYGKLLDYLSNKTLEYSIGGKIYDLEQVLNDPVFQQLVQLHAEELFQPLLGPLNALGHWLGQNFPTPNEINQSTNDFFNQAQNWRPARRDPLTLDLDGDGIETTAQTGWNGVLFDHNGDGQKTGTGWLSGDDGFLKLDKNNNGTIDNGKELFGDNTQLSNGAVAADGFAALADIDSNQDGVIDSYDNAFANLRVWQDLNQDGISQAEELKSLDQLGIASLSTTGTVSGVTQNGNTITHTGTFTKTDGTTGQTANLDLASSSFYTEYSETGTLSATDLARADIYGSGKMGACILHY